MKLPALLKVPDHPREGYTTSIEYEWAEDGPRVATIAVSSREHEVTGEVLRWVRPAELSREHLADAVSRFGAPVVPTADEIAEIKKQGARSGHTLELIQNLYRFAELTKTPPMRFVIETAGLSAATAGRWIRASKDALGWGDSDNEQH